MANVSCYRKLTASCTTCCVHVGQWECNAEIYCVRNVCGLVLLCNVLTVNFRQPSHQFTFGVGMSFIPYPLVLTPLV
jgi:hypothetical protein